MRNNNSFNYENANFIGPVQNVNGNVTYNSYYSNTETKENASYIPEPLWRSPLTLGILTWISTVISIISVIPLGKYFVGMYSLFVEKNTNVLEENITAGFLVFAIMALITLAFWTMRTIAKKQLRKPLFWGLAISGKGQVISIEKIRCGKCPICNGKMKYYNKVYKWRDVIYTDGKQKREILEKRPAIVCERNRDHYRWVDPAEDRI